MYQLNRDTPILHNRFEYTSLIERGVSKQTIRRLMKNGWTITEISIGEWNGIEWKPKEIYSLIKDNES